MAACALAKEGFVVSTPIFTSPSFDLISKWGRALHAIQVKAGNLCSNGMTVQWPTRSSKGVYTEEDCTYFACVLVPKNAIWWIPFSEVEGRRSICTNLERDKLGRYLNCVDSLKCP